MVAQGEMLEGKHAPPNVWESLLCPFTQFEKDGSSPSSKAKHTIFSSTIHIHLQNLIIPHHPNHNIYIFIYVY